MKCLNKILITKGGLTLFIIILFLAVPAFSKVITQFVPSLSITENYTDNYNQAESNKVDEFSTTYRAGFSFGIVDKNANIFLDYRPGYTDYASFDEDDSWSHDLSIVGQSQVSKHTLLTFSENFVRDLNHTTRTNIIERHDTNTTLAGLVYEFGPKDSFGLNYTFSFDDYENSNADEYTSHNPSAFFTYWFVPQFGIDSSISYEKTKYEISTDKAETWSGNIRLLKAMTPHFNIYISYAHTFTDQTRGDHTVYNPSVGFDWLPTQDSGISIGSGMLFQEWDNQNSDDSQDIFFDLDAYKTFDFSRKGTLSITGSSGYTATSDDAASLGFEIYYRAGALLTYRLTRRLTAELNGSYQISQYDAPDSNRQDNRLKLGAELAWSPLQWLACSFSYSFNDFNTDDTIREDYQENVGTFTINLTPPRPVRFDGENSRAVLENRLFE